MFWNESNCADSERLLFVVGLSSVLQLGLPASTGKKDFFIVFSLTNSISNDADSEHLSHWGDDKSAPSSVMLTWNCGVMELQKREKGLVKRDAGEVTVKEEKINNEGSRWVGDREG